MFLLILLYLLLMVYKMLSGIKGDINILLYTLQLQYTPPQAHCTLAVGRSAPPSCFHLHGLLYRWLGKY